MARSSLTSCVALATLAAILWGAPLQAQSASPAAPPSMSPGVTASPAASAAPAKSVAASAGPAHLTVSHIRRGPPAMSTTQGARRARALASTEVFGYLPSWELAAADTLDLERLTTLAWFGLEAHPDGRLIRTTPSGAPTPGWAGWTGQAFTDLMARAHHAGVRVVLTVERFAWDADGEQRTIALLQDPGARRALVGDIVATITERGADGVTLDFEPLPKVVRKPFTALVRALRAAMDAVDPGLQLTVALTPDAAGYEIRSLTAAGAADAVLLMGYDHRTAASRVAGSVDPLADPQGSDLRESVKAVLRRVPASRVILGLPWYGRAWSTTGPGVGARTRTGASVLAPSTAEYADAVKRAIRSGRLYDRTAGSAWSRYRASACATCLVSWRQLWYDDVDSIRAKVGFALRRGLRGVGIWALGYQGSQPELWSALRLAVEGRRDPSPPSGTVTLAPASILGERDGLPVVGDELTVDLVADDGRDGSGVAFVRISTGGRLTRDGRLVRGVTFPATDAISISMPDAGPVDEVFIPAGSASRAERLSSPPLRPQPGPASGPRRIRVQWRDVAGNWSRPVVLRVYHRSGA